MFNIVEVVIICIIVFTFGLSIGAMLIASADNCDDEVTEIIYNAGYEKGYRDGKKEGATDDRTEQTTGATSSQI